MSGGFSLGNQSAPASSAPPFKFGTQLSQPASNQPGGSSGFSLSALSSATNPPSTPSTGFSFGNKPATGNQTLGGATTATQPAAQGLGATTTTTATTTQSMGFSFGTKPATGTTGFNLGGAAKPSGGLSLTSTAPPGGAITTSSGFTFGAAPSTNAGKPLTLSGTTKPGFTFGTSTATTSTAAPNITLAPSAGLTLGGLGGSASQPPASASANKGLGGVDPQKDANTASGSSGKPGTGKAVKEQNMPNELVETVAKFKDYVKVQKDVREKITMMSSQSMYKIKDQTASLKHLLSTVSMGLQRNIVAIDKLKEQTSQELHNIEMAHRTKETPAGLQYENTAPSEYFHQLLESFDSRMCLYRKLIEDTEGYLLGAQQSAVISPHDLFVCLKRLHETFISLAAQLQGIHEKVTEQKEQYLAYRKVFHHDETDVFTARKKSSELKANMKRTKQPLGPTPFTGLSNYAAMKMTAAMARQNQQQAPTGFGSLVQTSQPPTTGLFGNNSTTNAFGGFGSQPAAQTGFGSSATNPSAGGLFGKPAQTSFGFGSTATTKPTGFGFGSTNTSGTTTGTSFGFGSTATNQQSGTSFGFGSTSTNSGGLFGSQTAAVKPLGIATPQSLASSAPGFSLQQPPFKRTSN